jgi:hypothetical protein
MRLGSHCAEGGHPRACGPGDDDAPAGLNRAGATRPAGLRRILARLDESGPRLAPRVAGAAAAVI